MITQCDLLGDLSKLSRSIAFYAVELYVGSTFSGQRENAYASRKTDAVVNGFP